MDVLYRIMQCVFNMSVTAGVTILFVLALRFLLRRAPKRFSYLLWGIVLFRLLCPASFSLPTGFSALGLVNAPVTETGRAAFFTGAAYVQYPSSAQDAGDLAGNVQGAGNRSGSAEGAGKAAQRMASPFRIPYAAWAAVWLSGMFLFAVYQIVSALRLRRLLACSLCVRDNLYLADDISAPFVAGVWKPRIYLPSGLDENEWKYVVPHEQCHIRRHDHIIKPVAVLCLALHWFNPLVWLAFALAIKDMEMSCDEAVMRGMDGDARAAYAASILRLTAGRKFFAASATLAFGESGTKSRIKNIMRYKKPAFLTVVLASAACAAGAVFLLADPAAAEAEPKAQGQTAQKQEMSGQGTEETPETKNEAARADRKDIEEQALIDAVMGQETWSFPEPYDFTCCSFMQLKRVQKASGRVTFYGWALRQVYRFSEDGIEEVSGSHTPVAVTFQVNGRDYQLLEYWMPRDGSYFAPDVRAKFPADIAADGLDSQKFILGQIQNCYAQAVAYGKLDTDAILEKLLHRVCSAPKESSNPQDYIDANLIDYREMLYYGNYTLRYCQSRLAKGQAGLEGEIMERLCEELL